MTVIGDEEGSADDGGSLRQPYSFRARKCVGWLRIRDQALGGFQ